MMMMMMMMMVKIMVCAAVVSVEGGISLTNLSVNGDGDGLWKVSEMVSKVIDYTTPSCSLIIFTDNSTPSHAISQMCGWGKRATTIIETGIQTYDNSTSLLKSAITLARQVRVSSGCTVVVAVSHNTTFLSSFAEISLSSRLLIWSTRLILVTHLPLNNLILLTHKHWTFTMMNVLIINIQEPSATRCSMYVHLPFTGQGPKILSVGSWTKSNGIKLATGRELFPDKFLNFHGSTINTTPKPFLPFWGEEKQRNITKYTGSDYHMLLYIAKALNFTLKFVPAATWSEATELVQERVSLICPIYHILMIVRKEKYDFTYTYEFAYFSFAMAKPGLEAQWQSLYRPLSHFVWIGVLMSCLAVPILLYFVSQNYTSRNTGIITVIQDVTGLLLGQNLPPHLPSTTSTRILITAWLIFSIIFGAAYRGNLTASLTIPKYPPRAETLQDLVTSVERITIPSYGDQFRSFYQRSKFELFRELASLMNVGIPVKQGLQEAIDKKQGHLGGRRYLQQTMAQHFTGHDGRSPLYLGRESIFPGPSGWPIPHDAPYKTQLDRWIITVLEAGLYEKWVDDTLTQTAQRRKRKKAQQENDEQSKGIAEQSKGISEQSKGVSKGLTLPQLQGLFMLLLLGFIFALDIFVTEVFWKNWVTVK